MKTTLLTLALVTTLAIGNTFAQRGYDQPAQKSKLNRAQQIDNKVDLFKLDQLDHVVKLSFQQEKAINKIENRYDKLVINKGRYLSDRNLRELEQKKQQEIFEVLTPVQRQKLLAFQGSNNRYDNKGGYGPRGDGPRGYGQRG
ncbi:hypothetical protein [Arsenicibacter rosenii]|uniref:DUF4890 domain-containing protein n=1 Tax=Arsenicibacter rosenii TaxID=1750698 RepID=A0A1S2VNM1_9BACT|nr:hypothetical protein [Arsenicibacter rosenii]OIN60359.1 hypothetical protein BLX24_05910 [Arsenicibacter rosenii]